MLEVRLRKAMAFVEAKAYISHTIQFPCRTVDLNDGLAIDLESHGC